MDVSPRINRRLLLAIAAAVVLALGIARFDSYFRQPLTEEGDAAVNALQIDDAKHLAEIYGNYSRYEFNHPGPAFFYVYAAAEWLLHDFLHLAPTPQNAHLFGGLVLQSLFFALGLAIFRRHVPHRAFLPLALAAGFVYFGSLGTAYVNTWPPNVLLMPFVCFMAAVTSVACGHLEHLPIATIAGGFLVHGHVAQPLIVGSLGALALAWGIWQARRATSLSWSPLARQYRASIVATLAIVAVFLLPIAIDVITRGERGNVATIWGRLAYNSGRGKSAYKSFLYFVSFATGSDDQEHLMVRVGPQLYRFLAGHAWRIAFWAVVFFLPTTVAWLRGRHLPAAERRFLLTAGAILGATVGLCVLWGMAQTDAMYNFNGRFYYGVYYFALLLALALLAPVLHRVAPPPVAIVATAGALVVLAWQERWTAADGYGPDFRRNVDRILAVEPAPRPRLLVCEQNAWPCAAAIALELQRRGIAFYMAPWWAFVFKREHDFRRLGERPEDRASVWWITHPGPGGIPVTRELSLFTQPAPIQPGGDEINLAGGANGFRYVVRGVSAGNSTYARTELPSVAFRFVAMRAEHDVQVTLAAQPIEVGPKDPLVECYLNGVALRRMVFHQHAEIGVRIPMDVWNRQTVATLEFRLPKTLPQRTARRPDFVWWAGLEISKITFGSGGGLRNRLSSSTPP